MNLYPKCIATLILVCCISLQPVFGQLEAAWWFLQEDLHLDFRSSPPTVVNQPGGSWISIMSSSMCDDEGNLRFVGDFGAAVDRSNTVMPGSFPLISTTGPSRAVGQVLAVETDVFNQYLLVIGDGVPGALNRNWRVRTVRVDMNQRGGLGDVRGPTQELLPTSDVSVYTGGYSCEADQYWLVIAESAPLQSNQTIFHAFRLEGAEFADTAVISVVSGVEFNFFGTTAGNSFRFSPNLRRMLISELRVGTGRVSALDFDPFTGIVSNPIPVGSFWETIHAVEFSPNSEIGYVADADTLFQYDLSVSPPARTILAAGLTATGDVPFSYPSMQLAPDGTLYISAFNREGLDVVLSPNTAGPGADFQRNYIPLPFPRAQSTLPYFGAHYFNIPIIPGELQGDTVICPFDSLPLRNTLVSDDGFIWSPAEFIDDPFAREPVFSYSGFPRSDTTIVMTVQLQEGVCAFPKKISITLKGQPDPPQIGGSPVVCPFVDSVQYWVQADTVGGSVQWLVKGGEILSGQGSDSVQVNWFDTNTEAEVQVIRTDIACRPDTGRLSVRIKIRLEPATPTGIDLSCWEPGTVLRYETFPPTQGSVYTWGTTNGAPVSGQGTPVVNFAWTEPGLQQVWVNELSTTIDTVCVGVSDTFLVDLYVDSSRVEMGRVSVDFDDPTRIIGEGYAEFHPLASDNTLVWLQEIDGGMPTIADYIRTDSVRIDRGPEMPEAASYRYRLVAENSCGDPLASDWHRLVRLEGSNDGGAGPISLRWNGYEGWPVDRYEVWRQTERSDWTLLETLPAGQLDYTREDILAGLVHRYQVRAWQADGGYHSWSNPIELRFAHPLSVPNVFTPNGDGINETFVIENLDLYPDHQLDVYDRWGRQVFSAAPYRNDWAAADLKAGTYYYSFRVQSAAIEEIPAVQRGWVMVLR